MKKSILWLLVLIVSVSMVGTFSMSGCKKSVAVEKQAKEEEAAQTEEIEEAPAVETEKLKVVFYIPATLGDKAWADNSAKGFDKAIEEMDIEGKFIEGGFDASKYEPDLEQLSKGDWDLVITATPSIINEFNLVAQNNPDQKYIYLDDYNTTDFSEGKFKNVVSVPLKQNEASFLAGVLAALIIPSDMPYTNHQKIIGFIGGMDVPPMKDFLVGYVQGAQYYDPEIEVVESYANTFGDPAIGKELALAQYDQGVNIIYSVAGMTGLGVLDAAKDRSHYVIGVDADQAMLYKDSDPEKAKLIVTSVLKYFGYTTYNVIKLFKEDELEFGKSMPLGLKEGAVGIAENEIYNEIIPEEFRDKISELKEKIISGEIKVESAIGL